MQVRLLLKACALAAAFAVTHCGKAPAQSDESAREEQAGAPERRTEAAVNQHDDDATAAKTEPPPANKPASSGEIPAPIFQGEPISDESHARPDSVGIPSWSPYVTAATLAYPVYSLRPRRDGLEEVVSVPLRATGDAAAWNIVFAGDLMPPAGGRVPVVAPALREAIAKASLVFFNLEATVSAAAPPFPEGPGRYFTNSLAISTKNLGEILAAFGAPLDRVVINVANNHAYDEGLESMQTTLFELRALGIKHVVGLAEKTVVHEIEAPGGLKLGWLGWTELLNNPRRLREALEINKPGTGQHINFNALKKERKLAAIIATPHWGTEHVWVPNLGTQKIAAVLAGNGVDLLVGHGPHVIQPIETIAGMRCFYSIGNILAPRVVESSQIGMLLRVDFSAQGGIVGYDTLLTYQEKPAVGSSVHISTVENADAGTKTQVNVGLQHIFSDAKL